MATSRPLVIGPNGRGQALQSADTLNAPTLVVGGALDAAPYAYAYFGAAAADVAQAPGAVGLGVRCAPDTYNGAMLVWQDTVSGRQWSVVQKSASNPTVPAFLAFNHWDGTGFATTSFGLSPDGTVHAPGLVLQAPDQLTDLVQGHDSTGALGLQVLASGGLRVAGTFDESTALVGAYLGMGDSPRLMLADGDPAKNLQVDNRNGYIRFYRPGIVLATIDGAGNLVVAGNLNVGGTLNGMGTLDPAATVGTAAYHPATDFAQAITLNTAGVLLQTPVTFANSGGTFAGTLALNTQAAGTVLAGPPTGAAAPPTFRALVAAEIPALGYLTPAGTETVTGAKTFTARQRIDAHTALWKPLPAAVGGTITIDWSAGDRWYGTLASGATTLAYTLVPAAGQSQVLMLRLKQPAAGAAGTITWPTPGSKFPGGTIALSALNGAVDYVGVSLDPGGTLYETSLMGANYS